jgi:hypothetical protein
MRQRINRIGHVPIPPMIWMQGISQAHILLHALAWRIETDPTDEFAMFFCYPISKGRINSNHANHIATTGDRPNMATLECENTCFRYRKYRYILHIGYAIGVPKTDPRGEICAVRFNIMTP